LFSPHFFRLLTIVFVRNGAEYRFFVEPYHLPRNHAKAATVFMASWRDPRQSQDPSVRT